MHLVERTCGCKEMYYTTIPTSKADSFAVLDKLKLASYKKLMLIITLTLLLFIQMIQKRITTNLCCLLELNENLHIFFVVSIKYY